MDPDLGRDLCRAHKAAIEEEEGSGQNLLMGHLRIVNITLQYIPGGKVLYMAIHPSSQQLSRGSILKLQMYRAHTLQLA